jgi:ABC-type branched-subunit amino acid transport system substrate-binding protein
MTTRTFKSPLRHFAAAAVVVSVLSLIACSSSSPGSSSPGSGSTSGTSSSAIKVGMIADLKTAVYDGTPNVTAVMAGIRGINAAGGIDGRKVVLIVCNGNDNPNTTAACARTMVADKITATVFTLSVAGAGGQVAAILGAAGIPQVGPAALEPAEFAAPNNFVIAGGPPYDYGCMTYTGVKVGYKKQLNVESSGGADESGFYAAADQAVKNAGGSIVGTISIPSTATDYAPYAQSIISSKAQAMIGAGTAEGYEQMLRLLNAAGSHQIFEVNSGAVNFADFPSLGKLTNGTIVCQPFPPQSAVNDPQFPQLKTLQSELNAENAAGDTGTTWATMSGNAEWAWWDTQAFYDLAKLIKGTVDAQSVMQELKTVKNLNVGLIPPWTPSTLGPAGFKQVSNPWEYATVFENGTQKLLSTTPMNAAKAIENAQGVPAT